MRDRLLGIDPKDHDVASAATPAQVKALFPHSRAVGQAFGVMLVRSDRHDIEVATFRQEADYRDGRRPDHVTFTDAQTDASRRDFTINGLFEDPLTDPPRIIDFVRGQHDLDARIIRTIGDPQQRFSEDYLRMLRAVRFAARFDFEIEQKTARSIIALARHLSRISRERIGMELASMFTGARPARAGSLIQQLSLDAPVLQEDHHNSPCTTLEALGSHPPYACALAAWMLDRHVRGRDATGPPLLGPQARDARAQLKQDLEQLAQVVLPASGKRWRKALCLSNPQRDELFGVIALAPRLVDLPELPRWAELPVARQKRAIASPHFPCARRLLEAAARTMPDHDPTRWLNELDHLTAQRLEQGVAPPPLLTGRDLIDAGHQPGPKFAKWLDKAYDAQLQGLLTTRAQALQWLSQHGQAGSREPP